MALGQTAWNPLPHQHSPDEVVGLEVLLFGEEGRTEPPFCEVVYDSQVQLGNNVTTYMRSGFTAKKDNASMVFHPSTGAGETDKLRLRIPVQGYYEITYQPIIEMTGTTATRAGIAMNGSAPTTNSIAIATGASNAWSAPYVSVIQNFYVGDTLYFWALQTSGTVQWMRAEWYGNAKTRITARYLGPS